MAFQQMVVRWSVAVALVYLHMSASLACAAPGGRLLYLGLTEEGWQVFSRDLVAGTEVQLTHSKGDKKYPRYAGVTQSVVFRDSEGYVTKVTGDVEERYCPDWGPCARFVIHPEGNRFYYTWWGPGNRQRHHLWEQSIRNKSPSLSRRSPSGSFSEIALSPDGSMLVATHLYDVTKERLLLIRLHDDQPMEYLTPETYGAVFPSWSHDGQRVLFSRSVGDANDDVYEVDINTRSVSPVVQSRDTSEYRPVEDGSGRYVFFERRDERGVVVACLDRQNGAVEQLDLGREAKEPCWYE